MRGKRKRKNKLHLKNKQNQKFKHQTLIYQGYPIDDNCWQLENNCQ
ncbi:unnamed protein product [Paramecium octaurelia]|uniref:Uncharacterized protein n=1 Tax=Paramecium octaurelia TaxID=43137 RepID=A0A8S1TUW0_PAROT|nr:unnamed protein product [Paramecium octaurelia]